jgi:hypothetical protein
LIASFLALDSARPNGEITRVDECSGADENGAEYRIWKSRAKHSIAVFLTRDRRASWWVSLE